MILTLIIWLFVGCAAWGYGRIFLSVRSRDESGTSNLPPESLGARLYLGLLCLVCLLAAAALLLAFLTCLALFVSTREVNFFDTALYHQQAVKWLSDYGLVTGLAMIHVRYGSPSSWFAGAAALNHGFLAGREVPIVGGICFALLAVTSLISLWRITQGRLSVNLRTLAWVIFSGMLLTVSVLWNVEASLSPDLDVWIAAPVIALLAADSFGDPSKRAGL